MNSTTPLQGQLQKTRGSGAPLEMVLFVLFSFGVSLYSLYVDHFASAEFHEALVPHLGWPGTYMFPLIMGLSWIWTPVSRTRKCVMLLLMMYVLMGIGDWLQSGREDYDNPYLMYGRFRPIWDILIPVVWMLILSSKRVREYEKQEITPTINP